LAAGKEYITLLEMLGGSGASAFREKAGMPGFASGTGNSRFSGGLAIVGERGPEIVNFGSPVQIMSNSTSKNLLNGGGEMSRVFRDYQVQSAKETNLLAEKLENLISKVGQLAQATEMQARMRV
jgi:hypothetical protein